MKRFFDFRERLLLIVLAVFLAAKLFVLVRFHVAGWDESIYLGMGKYIYSGGASGLWENLRPLGLPVIIGLFWKLGLPYVLFAELASILFSLGSIVLTCLIGKLAFDKRTGIVAAAMLASSSVFFNYSSAILTEIPSTFFALAALLLFIVKRYYLGGTAAAIAMLFKFPHGMMLLLFGIMGLLSILNEKTSLLKRAYPAAKAMAAFAITTAPFLVFNYVVYNPYVGNVWKAVAFTFQQASWHQSNLSKAISNPVYNYLFYAVTAFKHHFLLIFVIFAAFFFWKNKWYANQSRLLLAVFALLYFGYFSKIVNKDDRFFLMFLPVLCIFAAASYFNLAGFVSNRFAARKSGLMIAKVALIGLFVLSFAVAIGVDGYLAGIRPSSEPGFVSEVYRLPAALGLNGTLLIYDPAFAAYSDNLYYHYSDLSGETLLLKGLRSSNQWEQKPVQAIIYSTDAIGCPTVECEQQKSVLLASLRLNYKEAYSKDYPWGVSYYVFVNESYPYQKNS